MCPDKELTRNLDWYSFELDEVSSVTDVTPVATTSGI
jgi:hypothetical protein